MTSASQTKLEILTDPEVLACRLSFSGTAVLTELDRWCAAVVRAKSETSITLTYPAIGSSRHTIFLVGVKKKHAIFGQLYRGDDNLRRRVLVRPARCGYSMMRRQGGHRVSLPPIWLQENGVDHHDTDRHPLPS